jgi:hypothetical protein
MGGQRRTLVVAMLLGALTLGGCASTIDAGIECEIPEGAQLVRGEDGGYLLLFNDNTTYVLSFANGACVFTNPVVATARAERSDADLIFIYDYYRLRLSPCLERFGFRVLAPPTRDRFVASEGNWSPYDSVFTAFLSAGEIAELGRACPSLPPKVFPIER